jgi:hypothetical protein
VTGIGDQAGQVTAAATRWPPGYGRTVGGRPGRAAVLVDRGSAVRDADHLRCGRRDRPSGVVSSPVADLTAAATTTIRGGDPATLVAELRAQTAALHGMRGDLLSSGYGPDMLDRLDKLLEAFTADGAGEKTQLLHSRAVLGAFG